MSEVREKERDENWRVNRIDGCGCFHISSFLELAGCIPKGKSMLKFIMPWNNVNQILEVEILS